MAQVIRTAKLEDAEGIAFVHVETWKECYKGVIPASYLQSLDTEERSKGWRYILAHTDQSCFVVELNSEIIGWVICGPNRDERGSEIYEIYGIYVLPKYWGTKAGYRLFCAAIETLGVLHPRLISLWVLKENERAQSFYEKQGFTRDGIVKQVDIGGKKLAEIRYEQLRP